VRRCTLALQREVGYGFLETLQNSIYIWGCIIALCIPLPATAIFVIGQSRYRCILFSKGTYLDNVSRPSKPLYPCSPKNAHVRGSRKGGLNIKVRHASGHTATSNLRGPHNVTSCSAPSTSHQNYGRSPKDPCCDDLLFTVICTFKQYPHQL
jgi:hypothetical protein